MTVGVGGGLNTRSSDFDIKPNESRQAHEIDFSRSLNAVSKRFGYTAAASLGAGYDSLLGLFGAYYSDGTKRLAFAADSAGVGYGGVYVTKEGSSSLTDSIVQLSNVWSTQNRTNMATYQDYLYVVNGSQKGIVWTKSVSRSWPLNAPGEPRITPMAMPDTGVYYDTTSYKLNGEYRYVISAGVFIDTGWIFDVIQPGPISSPVTCRDGRVMLDQFPPISPVYGSTVDSIYFAAKRTRANRSPLDVNDSLCGIPWDTVIATGDLANFVFIDSIPDESLSVSFLKVSQLLNWIGRDSVEDTTTTQTLYRYGSPSFVSSDWILYTLGGDTLGSPGIYFGSPRQKDTMGVAYMATFLDTITGLESDSGRSLFVFNDTGILPTLHHRKITIRLPTPPSGVTGVVRNLYRAHILTLGRDTTYRYKDSIFYYGEGYRYFYKWVDAFTSDTAILSPYYLVEQIKGSDSIYVDSIRYDSLSGFHRVWNRATPPSKLSDIFSYSGRMFGFSGSNFYWSRLDSASYWGAFDFVAVSPDDGDVITVAWPTRRAIRVFKNKSSYNVYQDADGNWSLSEVTNNIGCIAPKSHVVGMNGHYYLSSEGFVLESEGAYLERTVSSKLVSSKLNNFDKLPITTLANTYGTYNDGKCLWTIGDTTYVYDEKADAWSTWGFKIGGATQYNAGSSVKFLPGDTMYFYKPNGKTIFAFGGVDYDSALGVFGSIVSKWKSAPLLLSPRLKVLSSIGTWTSGDDTLGLSGNIYNESSTSLNSSLVFTSKATNRYQRRSVEKPIPSLFYQIYMQNTNRTSWSVNGFDLWFYEVGDYEIK